MALNFFCSPWFYKVNYESFSEFCCNIICCYMNLGFISFLSSISGTYFAKWGQVEIKRTIPKGQGQSKDFKTKKIFVGGIPSTVTEGRVVELYVAVCFLLVVPVFFSSQCLFVLLKLLESLCCVF